MHLPIKTLKNNNNKLKNNNRFLVKCLKAIIPDNTSTNFLHTHDKINYSKSQQLLNSSFSPALDHHHQQKLLFIIILHTSQLISEPL